MAVIAEDQGRDPLNDYLCSLSWDQKPRMDDWLTWGMGAHARSQAEAEHNRRVGRKWLIQAVARALAPGCKADVVLVLHGLQGAGKSSGLRELVGTEWFSDSEIRIGEVRGYMQLREAWVHELGEMTDIRRTEVDRLKQFLSAQEDKYVRLYGRHPERVPRRCVFVGTTNDDRFIGDASGGRRFWPVHVGQANRERLLAERDQLWAEAVFAYRSGESWWLNQEEEAEAEAIREGFRFDDAWEDRISAWFSEHPEVVSITSGEVMDRILGIPTESVSRSTEMRTGDCLRRLGWKRKQLRDGVLRRYFYTRPEKAG